jgi:NADPH:quinone reductase
VGFAEAAGASVVYLTAYFALSTLAKLRPGQFVVLTGATSSAGLAGIQVAHSLGAKAIATTRTEARRQSLLDHGADFALATETEDVTARVLEITGGRGADVVYDAVAGPLLEKLCWATKQFGRIIIYGVLDFAAGTPLPLMAGFLRNLKIDFYKIFDFTGHPVLGLPRMPGAVEEGRAFLEQELASGALRPVIDKTFPLEQYADAHRYMEGNAQMGKIVIVP